MYRDVGGVTLDGFCTNMDRNFERVYNSIITVQSGELRLTREYMKFYGFHKPKTDLPPSTRKAVFYDSVWKRYHLDRLGSDHFELAQYLFATLVVHEINLVPKLRELLNLLLPEGYSNLEPSNSLCKLARENLDAYLLWKPGGVDEKSGMDILLSLLESHLRLVFVTKMGSLPDKEDDVHHWLQLRHRGRHEINPTF